MTYREICALLRNAGIDSAEWDAALLIEHVCKIDASLVPTQPERDYASDALAAAVKKRADRYPLQYLIGTWAFFRQSYEVSPDCLIPRPDTEILVEEAIRRLPRDAVFADLCTGSGCIAISILAERPDTRALAVEKFPDTLALAQRNADRNGVADRFSPLLGDVLTDAFFPSDQRFDAILSNPPYIPHRVLSTLEPELCAEPTVALDGGEDGLIFYRAILSSCANRLKPNGFFLFEIGYDQADDLARIAKAAGFRGFQVFRDYGKNDRAVLITP